MAAAYLCLALISAGCGGAGNPDSFAECDHGSAPAVASDLGISAEESVQPGSTARIDWAVPTNTVLEVDNTARVECWVGDRWEGVWLAGNIFSDAGREPTYTLDLLTPISSDPHRARVANIAVPPEASRGTYRVVLFTDTCDATGHECVLGTANGFIVLDDDS